MSNPRCGCRTPARRLDSERRDASTPKTNTSCTLGQRRPPRVATLKNDKMGSASISSPPLRPRDTRARRNSHSGHFELRMARASLTRRASHSPKPGRLRRGASEGYARGEISQNSGHAVDPSEHLSEIAEFWMFDSSNPQDRAASPTTPTSRFQGPLWRKSQDVRIKASVRSRDCFEKRQKIIQVRELVFRAKRGA